MKFCENILIIVIFVLPVESVIGDLTGPQIVQKRGPNEHERKVSKKYDKNRRKSSRDRSFTSHYGQSDKSQKVGFF